MARYFFFSKKKEKSLNFVHNFQIAIFQEPKKE